MRVSRQGYEGRNDRVRDLRCGSGRRAVPRQHGNAANEQCRSPSTVVRHAPHRRAPSEATQQIDQEQIQIIATAIGMPKPSAPKIARTNSESRLTWCRTPDDVMTLLLGAPRATARPQDELSIAPLDQGPQRLSVIKQCWAVMVNKRLIGDREGFADRALTARRLIGNRAPALHTSFSQSSGSAPRRYCRLFLPPRPARRHSSSVARTRVRTSSHRP
jgi:hypothetical protein